MIREFWVKNFLSIKDKQELNFVAKSAESELVTKMPDGTLLYKLGVFYGSNASGKSNMLTALNAVFSMLVNPLYDASESIMDFHPFKLTKDEPTEMFVSFYANDVRYDYYLRYNANYILREELNYYPKGSKVLFYQRDFVEKNIQADIKFGASLHLLPKTQESIRENTLNNHSVLSICLKYSFKEDVLPFKNLHECIMEKYHEVDGDENQIRGIVDILKEATHNPKKHLFYTMMLQKADLNIVDFRIVKESRLISQDYKERIEKENISESVKNQLLNPFTESVVFENQSSFGNFEVSLNNQSKGTIKYIQILETLYDLITGSHVYYLDELGEDLHYDLLFYYLNVFLFNSNQSQLLITSQETSLLAQDIINENRGVVWFVEKNRESASSEYNRGDSFGLHKNLSLYNSYRIGRLGAKPELGSIFVDLED
jgi:AAA15 family ATPase/GTPase